jgi:vacuolar protein sorting-associated protein 54
LRIDERTYFAVSATAEVLVLLLDYLRVVVNLSLLTTDTMSRVIEFLKAFNSRTCQVVLGAGAMRSAGLKNITAKHLGEFYFFVWCLSCNVFLTCGVGGAV